MNLDDLSSYKNVEQKSALLLKALAKSFSFKIVNFGIYKKFNTKILGFKNELGWICDSRGLKIIGRSWNESLGLFLNTKYFLVPTADETKIIGGCKNYNYSSKLNEFYGLSSGELCIRLELLGYAITL